jgi:hypothetical protein
MVDDRRIIHEITPLMGKDVLYIADRHKKEFTYPIHNHSVYELNFVENAKGVRRIVGDSQEVIGDYDLCLITSPDLEHVWEQNECHSDDIREITIQFDFSMGDETLFGRNPYASITRMMQEAKKGLSFPMQAIMKVYGMLDTLSSVKDGFYAVQQFLTILYELSRCENARTLASSSYAKVTVEDDSRRILKVKNYISKNYMDELRLPELASLAGMSSSAFSRFFKLHTGRNISEYIIDLRYHKQTRESGFEIKMIPAWRPDKAMNIEKPDFADYMNKLGEVAGVNLVTFQDMVDALQKRHDFFTENGCKLSDHGIEEFYDEPYTDSQIETIFAKAMRGQQLSALEIRQYKHAFLKVCAEMDHAADWTQQYHYGAIRDQNLSR